MSYALCKGQRYQAVYFNRVTGECQYYLAQWDEGETKPIFEDNRYGDDIYTWTFTHTDGEECNGGDRTFDIVWKCDESAQPFSTNTQCQNDEDECYTEIIIPSVYACVEAVLTPSPTMSPNEPGQGQSSDSSGSSGWISLDWDHKDFVIVIFGVIIVALLVIIAGGIYHIKCRNGGKHVLLVEEPGNNAYNTMKTDNMQLTSKQ